MAGAVEEGNAVAMDDDDLDLLLTLEAEPDPDPEPKRASKVPPCLKTETTGVHAKVKREGVVASSTRVVTAFGAPKQREERLDAASMAAGQHHAELLSGLRVARPVMGSLVVRERAALFPHIRLSCLERAPVQTLASGWSTLGCVVDKSFPKQGAKGNKYLVLKLSDLQTEDTVSVFLFGDAFSEHGLKVAYGSIVLLQCAKAKHDEGQSDGKQKRRSGFSLSCDRADQVWLVGGARDYGVCKGTRRDGKHCTMHVNTSRSEYCKYHASGALKKLKAQKMNIRPQLGGSNYYAHQQKELGRQERLRMEAALRERGRRTVKPMSGDDLRKFTDRYEGASGVQGGRGIGAIRAVATSKERNTAAAAAVAAAPEGRGGVARLPGGKRVAAGRGAGERVVKLAGGGAPKDAYSKALDFVRSMGGLPAPDPNRTVGLGYDGLGAKRKPAAAAGAGGAAKRRAVGRPGEDDARPDFLKDRERKKSAKQGKFLASFSAARKQAKETNKVESLYRREAEDQDFTDATRRLNPMMQREELEEQLAGTHKIKVKGGVYKRFWECCACGQRCDPALPKVILSSFSPPPRRCWLTHSYFSQRLTTVGVKYPTGRCPRPQCGGETFRKAGMVRATKAVAPREELMVRGKEHGKFLRSVR